MQLTMRSQVAEQVHLRIHDDVVFAQSCHEVCLGMSEAKQT